MFFNGLMKGTVENKEFLADYNNLLKITDIVASAMKHMVAQHNIEVWETATAIPTLVETYTSLVSLKKLVGGAFLSAGSSEQIQFTMKERESFKEHVAIIEANKKVLRTLFGICVDPENWS